MDAKRKTAIESAAAEIIQEWVEVDHDKVAEALAREIVTEHVDDELADAIADGVKAAIDEIDGDAFTVIAGTVQDRVSAEIEGQAKAIALRMLRELADRAKAEATVEVA